jgi:hypothetical protein
MKSNIFFVVLVIFSSMPMWADEKDAIHISFPYEAHNYEYVVSSTDLLKSPLWNPDMRNPPLPVQDAVRLAKKQLSKLIGKSKEFELESVTLKSAGEQRWFYAVKFNPPLPPHGLDGFQLPFTILVLMNGTAVEPKVFDQINPNQ